MCDRFVAVTFKPQHTTLTNIHAPVGIRTNNLSRQEAADLLLRPRGHWKRQYNCVVALNQRSQTCKCGWVAPISVWKGAENIAHTGIRSSDPPFRSKSLYRLFYTGNTILQILNRTKSAYNVTYRFMRATIVAVENQ